MFMRMMSIITRCKLELSACHRSPSLKVNWTTYVIFIGDLLHLLVNADRNRGCPLQLYILSPLRSLSSLDPLCALLVLFIMLILTMFFVLFACSIITFANYSNERWNVNVLRHTSYLLQFPRLFVNVTIVTYVSHSFSRQYADPCASKLKISATCCA